MKVGIIGAGGIAGKFHLPELTALPGCEVTLLVGRKPARLKLLAERFQIPNWTTDYRAALADDRIEAVVIALPHPLHVAVGLEALAAGKHILMQKPLCGDLESADRFVSAVEQSNRTVLVLPHYSADIYHTRSLLEEGAIGTISAAHCRVSHGGPEVYYAEVRDSFEEPPSEDLWFFGAEQAAVGALFDMGVYAVGVLVTLLGAVESVMGEVATCAKPTSLEDTAALLLRFAGGALGTAETGWCDPARTWELRIHGTQGKVTLPGHEGASATLWEPGSYTREDIPAVPLALQTSESSRGSAHAHWLKCIQETRQPECSNAWTARHLIEILLAGLQSARTGQRVSIRSHPNPPRA